MTPPEIPSASTRHDPAHADDATATPPALDPNSLIATLNRIGTGAAADDQPWPEPHPLPGRRLALADADCALAGLRVVQELLLAAERTRQNGAAEDYVGDRVMEGLMLACLALTCQASARLQPGG